MWGLLQFTVMSEQPQETDMPDQDERLLIELGLLPDPNQCQAMMADRGDERGPSPLVPHYERTMHELADELEWNRGLQRRLDARLKASYAHADRVGRAVRWLRDVYEFDELAQRVIAHSLFEA